MAKKRKLNIIVILFLLLIFQYPILMFAQNEHLNLIRYWYYRDRLKYFVIPGNMMGESEVAGIRNNLGWGPPYENIDFGQHGCYFGYYLGILATEYKLLTMNNQNEAANCDVTEAQMALNQFVNYMDKCEHLFGTCQIPQHPNYCDIWNGFFIRNCVDAEYLDIHSASGYTAYSKPHLNILNQDLTNDDEWDGNIPAHFGNLPAGHPGKLLNIEPDGKTIRSCVYDRTSTPVAGKENMSQDEAIGVLLGLSLVYKYMPDLSSYAADIANQIILHVSNGDSWVIVDPNGNSVSDGAYAIDYAFGFAEAGQYFGFPPFAYTNPGFLCLDFAAKRNVWDGIGITGYVSPTNCTMECTLAAIGASWGIYPFPCSTVPLVSATMSGIINKCVTSYSAHNETFYCLLFNRLHPEHTVSDDILRIAYDQLSLAPEEGPYFYDRTHHAPYGWASSYRWHMDTTYISGLGDPTDQARGNFSGMDYMLLYNMYVLASGYPDITGYYPRSNVKLGANLPISKNGIIIGDINHPECFVACNYIESDAKIRNSVRYRENQTEIRPENQIASPGDICYISKSINLKPGFIVEKKAKFQAKVVSRISWDFYFKYNTTFFSHYGLVDPTYFGCWYNYPFVSGTVEPSFKEDDNYSISIDTIKIKRSIDIDKRGNSSIKIFPNPASSKLTITIDGQCPSDGQLFITDFNGQILISKQLITSSTIINIQDLLSGIYLIHIRIFEQDIVKKLIKL